MRPVRRTWTLLVAALAAGALLLAAALATGREEIAPAPTLASAPTAADEGMTVGSPTGKVLAEMTRRLGTPRPVARKAARNARERRRIAAEEARVRAAIRAARAARRAARLAAQANVASRDPSDPNVPYWWDPDAAAVPNRAPVSGAERQWLNDGIGGWVEPSGFARAPANAPAAIHRVIQAGNLIARSPYRWGGGHGAWQDKGYDCSGSVSYALAAGNLLGWSQTSGQLMGWGDPGPGHWLTVYAHGGHVFMVVAGLRFDTSGRSGDHASRWQLAPRSVEGFAVRHYPGL
jgi:cell wall-associated NlpC family hydrolase